MSEEIINKKNEITEAKQNVPAEISIEDLFPIVEIPQTTLEKYKKIPLASIASLGGVFSQIPEAARTITQTNIKQVAPGLQLFVGTNPKNVSGLLQFGQYGTSGNIMQVNSQGRNVIAGRLKFLPVNSLPEVETVATQIPFDPMLPMIAIAVMAIDKKLNDIQASIEDVLQFLELDKQAKQRGNLRKLAEIADEYKSHCEDKTFCLNRNNIIQAIQVEALQNIEFYQNKISTELQKQKTLHIFKDANDLLNTLSQQFAEYQLSCYEYAYCAFFDIMLRKDFNKDSIDACIHKMSALAEKYNIVYERCHSQIEGYRKSAVESRIFKGISAASTGLGRAISSIPKIKDGPVDEALIKAGKSITEKTDKISSDKLKYIEIFADNRLQTFIENLNTVKQLYNSENSVLTDGENLFVLNTAS